MQDLIAMFGLTMSLWDIVLRSSAGFLGLVALVRIVPKRNTGRISPNDMLILIVMGSIGADAVTGGSTSIGDLLLMITCLLLLGYLMDVLQFHVPFFRRLMRHEERPLIEDGRIVHANMRREKITEEELMAELRRSGINDPGEIFRATLEADGEISVLRKPGGRPE